MTIRRRRLAAVALAIAAAAQAGGIGAAPAAEAEPAQDRISTGSCQLALDRLAAHEANMAAAQAQARGQPARRADPTPLPPTAVERPQTAEPARDAQPSVPPGNRSADGSREADLLQRHAVLRREASIACLGNPPPKTERRPFPDPPVRVPPTLAPPDAAPRPPPTPDLDAAPAPASRDAASPPAAAPPRPRAPTAITSCDALGCWANDGSRLNRMGPDLVGERGICKAQGRTLRCP